MPRLGGPVSVRTNRSAQVNFMMWKYFTRKFKSWLRSYIVAALQMLMVYNGLVGYVTAQRARTRVTCGALVICVGASTSFD